MKKLVTLLAAGLTAATIAGCSAPATTTSSGNETPRSGGEVTHLLASVSANNWQIPGATNWHQQQVLNQILETLVFLDADGGVHPWLAQSWEKNDAGTEYILHLKDGVTFSDGSPFDAAVVVKNLGVINAGQPDRGKARIPAFTKYYKTSEVVDPLTVKVTLSQPDSGFIRQLGHHSTGIQAASSLDATQEQQSKLETLIGTGPFVFDSQIPEKEITLRKREDYNWAPEAFSHSGPGYLDKIHFVVVPEGGARIGSLEAGSADSAYSVTATDEVRLKDLGYTVINRGFQSSAHGYAIKQTAPFVDDVRVRQAIQSGIDRQEIVDTLFNDSWAAATSNVSANLPGHVDLSDDLIYDPDRSRSLLEAAGWADLDSDGYRVKEGKRLELTAYPTPFLTYSQNELQLVAQQLARIGIKVNIVLADDSSYSKRSGQNDVALTENTGTLVDISSQRQWEHGELDENRYRVNDPKLNALLDGIVAEQDESKRDDLAEQYQRYVIENAYYIPLEDDRQVYVTSPDLKGVFLSGPGRVVFYDAWLNK